MNRFWADAFEHSPPTLDLIDINIQRSGDLLFGYSALYGAQDQKVLLNNGQTIDSLVIGERLVVSGQ